MATVCSFPSLTLRSICCIVLPLSLCPSQSVLLDSRKVRSSFAHSCPRDSSKGNAFCVGSVCTSLFVACQQGCAAAELYNRHWQYHKTWKKWFLCEDPYNRRLPASSQQGGTAGHPGTSSASDGVSGGAGDTSTGGGGGWGSGSSLQRSSTGSSTANSSSSGGGRGAGSDKREHTTTTTPVNGEVEPARNIAGGENTAGKYANR